MYVCIYVYIILYIYMNIHVYIYMYMYVPLSYFCVSALRSSFQVHVHVHDNTTWNRDLILTNTQNFSNACTALYIHFSCQYGQVSVLDVRFKTGAYPTIQLAKVRQTQQHM